MKKKWNWTKLSENLTIDWNIPLIDRFKHKWNWACLSKNASIIWSFELLEKFSEYWDLSSIAILYDGEINQLTDEQVLRLLKTSA